MASTNDLVSLIKYRVSRQQDSSIDSRIIAELKAAQDSLENKPTLPWFLISAVSVTVNGPHDTFSLQEISSGRFLRLEQDYGVRVEEPTHEEGKKALCRTESYAELVRYYPGEADAATYPEAYAVLGPTVYVRKQQVVSRTYSVGMYLKDATFPAAGNSTNWTQYQSELLMAEAGFNVARWLRDREAMQLFDGDRMAAYTAMVKTEQARKDADQNYVMGDGNGT